MHAACTVPSATSTFSSHLHAAVYPTAMKALLRVNGSGSRRALERFNGVQRSVATLVGLLRPMLVRSLDLPATLALFATIQRLAKLANRSTPAPLWPLPHHPRDTHARARACPAPPNVKPTYHQPRTTPHHPKPHHPHPKRL